MTRNLSKRIEVAVPVRAPSLRRKLGQILDVCLRDKRQAWLLQSDATYLQLQPDEGSDGAETLGTHETLMNLTHIRDT